MDDCFSRRTFLAVSAAASLGIAHGAEKRMPVGLELYSVRGELAKDLAGTVRAVAKMGYEVVEFYAPYFDWTPERARDVRKLLDDLGVRCHSTHNNTPSFTAGGITKAIELNRILGAKYIVMASAGRVNGITDAPPLRRARAGTDHIPSWRARRRLHEAARGR